MKLKLLRKHPPERMDEINTILDQCAIKLDEINLQMELLYKEAQNTYVNNCFAFKIYLDDCDQYLRMARNQLAEKSDD